MFCAPGRLAYTRGRHACSHMRTRTQHAPPTAPRATPVCLYGALGVGSGVIGSAAALSLASVAAEGMPRACCSESNRNFKNLYFFFGGGPCEGSSVVVSVAMPVSCDPLLCCLDLICCPVKSTQRPFEGYLRVVRAPPGAASVDKLTSCHENNRPACTRRMQQTSVAA